MNKEKQTWYYLYRTRNIINNKEYIGVRKTDNLFDGYIGCGVRSQKTAASLNKSTSAPFIRAVVKYGYDNFIKEILFFFNSYEELLIKEFELITEEYIKEKTLIT